jgi:hypothetical protein
MVGIPWGDFLLSIYWVSQTSWEMTCNPVLLGVQYPPGIAELYSVTIAECQRPHTALYKGRVKLVEYIIYSLARYCNTIKQKIWKIV